MMLNLFKKKSPTLATRTGIDINNIDFDSLPVLSPQDLLRVTGQSQRIKNIRRILKIDQERFRYFYEDIIYNFIEVIQLMPASQSHHHAVPGGLLIHSLEVLEYALTYRQQYKLPMFAEQETQEKERHVWTYAVFIAALLHDIGKRVTMCSFIVEENKKERIFSAFEHKTMLAEGYGSYKIIFQKSQYFSLHEKIGLIFLNRIVPAEGQRFLFQYLHIMKEMMAFIHGDKLEQGTIGKIITDADKSSTGKSLLHINTRKVRGATTENIGERLMTQLRVLLASNDIICNKQGAQCFTNDEHAYLVCPAAIDTVRNSMYKDDQTGIPRDNNRIFDIYQEYGFAETNTATGKSIHYIATEMQDNIVGFTVLKFKINKLFQIRPEKIEGSVTEISKSDFSKVKDGSYKNATVAVENNHHTGTGNSIQVGTDNTSNTNGTENALPHATDNITSITGTGVVSTATDDLIESLLFPTTTVEKQNQAPPPLISEQIHSDHAQQFMQWARDNIKKNDDNLFKINKSGSLVNQIMSDGKPCVGLVSPKVFHLFAKAIGMPCPDKDRDKVQNAVHQQKINIKAGNGQVHYLGLKVAHNNSFNKNVRLSFYLFSLDVFCNGDEELIALFEKTGINENLFFMKKGKPN